MFKSSKLRTSNELISIWVLELNSGICIFQQNYTDGQEKGNLVEPDLISGFLMAMRNFGREITRGDIQNIEFNNLRIAITTGQYVILASAVKERASIKGIKALMGQILFEFELRFHKYLAHWNGNCDPFGEFSIFLDNFLNKTAKVHKEEDRIGQVLVEQNPNLDVDSFQEGSIKDIIPPPKKALINTFIRQIQEKNKPTWINNMIHIKTESQYQTELKNKKKLIRIYQNRENMRHTRHKKIEIQMIRMRAIIQREVDYLKKRPYRYLYNIIMSQASEETKRQMHLEAKKKKKIQELTRKITILQDKLTRLTKI